MKSRSRFRGGLHLPDELFTLVDPPVLNHAHQSSGSEVKPIRLARADRRTGGLSRYEKRSFAMRQLRSLTLAIAIGAVLVAPPRLALAKTKASKSKASPSNAELLEKIE